MSASSSIEAGASSSIDAGGLLLRRHNEWVFSEDALLAVAAAWPLDKPLSGELRALFHGDPFEGVSGEDPWRDRPGLQQFANSLGQTSEPPACELPPTASEAETKLKVDATEKAGRGLFTRTPTPVAGTLLLREEAFAAALWPCAFSTHCHYSLKPISSSAAAVRCKHSYEIYCSEECREEAWRKWHRYECGTLLHQITPRTVLMCVRALLHARDESNTAALDALLSLHDHASSMDETRLSQLRFHAYLAHAAIPIVDEVQLYKLLRIALTNSFAISEMNAVEDAANGDDGDSDAVVEPVNHRAIGEALFPTSCLFNHSCEPNTNIKHIGTTIEVRSSGHLRGSTECTICYGPQAGIESVANRRESLQRTHYFHCECKACVRDEKVATAEVEAFIRRSEAQALDDKAREACEAGQFLRAAEYSGQALELLRHVFPPGSPQIGLEEAKLARLLFNAEAPGTLPALRRAASSLAACHGEEDEEVADLRRLERMCAARTYSAPRNTILNSEPKREIEREERRRSGRRLQKNGEVRRDSLSDSSDSGSVRSPSDSSSVRSLRS